MTFKDVTEILEEREMTEDEIKECTVLIKANIEEGMKTIRALSHEAYSRAQSLILNMSDDENLFYLMMQQMGYSKTVVDRDLAAIQKVVEELEADRKTEVTDGE